jgi:hypothetical protein
MSIEKEPTAKLPSSARARNAVSLSMMPSFVRLAGPPIMPKIPTHVPEKRRPVF